MGKCIKRRDFIKILKNEGAIFLRSGSKHDIFTIDGKNFAVPWSNNISKGVVFQFNRFIKNIKKDKETKAS